MSVVGAPERVVAPSVTDADVLERAADLLGEFGWCRFSLARDALGDPVGNYDRSAVSFCHNGAILRAMKDLGIKYEARHGIYEHSFQGDGLTMRSGADWNNAPDRTKAEVVAKLREAAARARSAA